VGIEEDGGYTCCLIGALTLVTNQFQNRIEKLALTIKTEIPLKKTTLIGTARIIRSAMSM